MDSVFSNVLDMSLTASFVILAVLVVRFFLRKSPKVISYALWAVVLFRLLCPVSLTAPVSLLEATQPKVTVNAAGTSHVSYLPENLTPMPAPENVPEMVQKVPAMPAETKQEIHWNWLSVLSWVWLAGACAMVLHSIMSYRKLRRCLGEASQMEPGVFLADGIPTPFVMGILKPEIYLPSDTPTEEQPYILAHERHHIRRGDHIIKLFSFTALCVHWFNPLVWMAFILGGKDMEMSCDEAVIRQLGPEIRADYAQTLIRMASSRQMIAGTPLAFGEGDTKSRVKNMVKWKQPKTWVVLVSILLCILAVVVCAVNPGGNEQAHENVTIGMKLPRNISALNFGNERRKFFATEPIDDEIADQQIIPTSVLGGIEVHDTGDQPLSEKDAVTLVEELDWVTLEALSLDTPYGDMEVSRDNILRNYYQIGKKTYEVWFDVTLVDEKTRCDILESVYFDTDAKIEENMPEVTIHLPEQAAIGMKIPSDLETVAVENEIQFCPVDLNNGEVSEAAWGGVKTYAAPASNLNTAGMDTWLRDLGVPQMVDDMHDYMASGSSYADLEVSFIDAGGRETKHYYYTYEDSVFELWFNTTHFDSMTQAAVLGSVSFGPDAQIKKDLPMMHSEFPAEMAERAEAWEEGLYLEQCQSVLESLRSETSYCVKILRNNYGEAFLNDTSTSVYFQDGGEWLLIHKIPEAGFVSGVNQFGYMKVDGRYYSNENRGMDENEEVNWGPAQPDDSVLPWIATFDWNAQDVLYVSKIPAGKGLCFTLQVMAPYNPGHPDAYPHYQMQFVFNEDGAFERIENTFYFHNDQEGDYSTKETILFVSDSAENQIAYEYQRYLDMQS